MKKTYIKPQATVVAIEDKSQTLCAGSPNTTYGKSSGTTMGFDLDTDTNNTSGLSKRNSGGLWDDDEE